MNFLIPLEHFHIENVQFLKVKKNIVMENSFFIKMIYTDENIVMNGIYLDIPLLSSKQTICPPSFFCFSLEQHLPLVVRLVEMENDILQYYQYITPVHYEKKTPIYSLKSQLEKGYIKWGFSKKPFPKTVQHICLKISGIWENDKEFGINYKITPC